MSNKKYYQAKDQTIYCVRTATIKDISSIAKVHSESAGLAYEPFREMYPELLDALGENSLRKSWGEYMTKSVNDDNYIGIVAEKRTSEGNEIVAISKAKILDVEYIGHFNELSDKKIAPYEAKEYANLQSIYVLPEFQGKGIGKMIMSYFAEYYKEKGCNKAITETLGGYDASPKFFDKVGGAKLVGTYQENATKAISNNADKEEIIPVCLWEMNDINRMIIPTFMQAHRSQTAAKTATRGEFRDVCNFR